MRADHLRNSAVLAECLVQSCKRIYGGEKARFQMVLILVCKVADRKTRKLVYKLADCKTQKLRNNE